eukprot:1701344-Pleurochrysis_carterae.AAC.1
MGAGHRGWASSALWGSAHSAGACARGSSGRVEPCLGRATATKIVRRESARRSWGLQLEDLHRAARAYGTAFLHQRRTLGTSFASKTLLSCLLSGYVLLFSSLVNCSDTGSTLTASASMYTGILAPLLPCFGCAYFSKSAASSLVFTYAAPALCSNTQLSCGNSVPVSGSPDSLNVLISGHKRHFQFLCYLMVRMFDLLPILRLATEWKFTL